MRPDPAGRRARAAFRDLGLGNRVHVWIRWRSCPFAEVASAVPTAGDILDLGCGHGLFSMYLAILEPRRRITGMDIDGDKLAVARLAGERAGVDIDFRVGSEGAAPDVGWEAITIVDMLYLLDEAEMGRLLQGAARRLAPGGRLVVKEMNTRPRWKLLVNRAQEILATRVLRITEGDDLTFLPPATVVGMMRAGGLEVVETRLDRWRLHPHHLIVGTRPAAV